MNEGQNSGRRGSSQVHTASTVLGEKVDVLGSRNPPSRPREGNVPPTKLVVGVGQEEYTRRLKGGGYCLVLDSSMVFLVPQLL